MRLTGRIRVSITTAAVAVVVAAASTFAGQGEPPVPSAGSASPASDGRDPVIHVPAVHAQQALVRESKGTPPFPTTALARLDIPPTALLAYQRAAAVMTQADRSCRLRWTLLAAIGRVESDHGRHAGALLRSDGVSSPPIRGVALDGRGPVARIADTDGGILDGDRAWDRAVGPMQILPSTWSVVAVDGDGDGMRSPDDLDDAALAAGVFLCSGEDDLGTGAGRQAALLRYNPSRAYVASVLAVEQAYRTGDFTLQGQAPDPGAIRVVVNLPDREAPAQQNANGRSRARTAGDAPAHAAPGAEALSSPSAHQSSAPQPDGSAAPGVGSSPDHGRPGGSPTDGPGTPEPSDPGGGSSAPGDPGGGGSSPTSPPTSDPPTSDPPTTPPTSPPTSPPPEPAPEPAPELVTMTGTLARCESESTPASESASAPEPDSWCLDDTALDVGDEDYLAAPAAADLDGDGTVEVNADELDGLVGTTVSVRVLPDISPAVVVSVNGTAYRTP